MSRTFEKNTYTIQYILCCVRVGIDSVGSAYPGRLSYQFIRISGVLMYLVRTTSKNPGNNHNSQQTHFSCSAGVKVPVPVAARSKA